jgi:hypothetical protein
MSDYGGMSLPGRALERWGHWGAGILIASTVAAIGLGVRPLPAGTPIALLVPLLLVTLLVFSWIRMREHDRRLCEFCVQSMPLDAAEIAERMHRRFSVAHLGQRRELVLLYMTILVGSNGLLLAGTIGHFVWALVQASMIYLVLAYSGHRRFQPWCPQCRGGEPKVLVP